MEERRGAKYYLVAYEALPSTLFRVIRAKELLDTGQTSTVAKAAEMVGISRSAFYKYRDLVSPFLETGSSRIITFYVIVRNQPGVLSEVLLIFARFGANILTINQSIPVSGRAAVTISAETRDMIEGVQGLLDAVEDSTGVMSIEAISG